MALYLLMFRGGDPAEAGIAPEDMPAYMARWNAWSDDLEDKGLWRAGQPLENEGRVVEPNGVVSDGPFAETKELFVGFYLFECADLEAAIELAKRIPVSEMGGVEIRPAVWSESIALEPP